MTKKDQERMEVVLRFIQPYMKLPRFQKYDPNARLIMVLNAVISNAGLREALLSALDQKVSLTFGSTRG